MKNNMREYLEYHNACKDGLGWCVDNCTSMQDVWQKLNRYDWMLWLVSETKCLSDRECHKFGLWCAKRVEYLLTDDHSIAVLKAKRDWLDGKITYDELDVAGVAAEMAAEAAAREITAASGAASGVAWAAWVAAKAAARAGAREAACTAAREAAREASGVKAWIAAREAANASDTPAAREAWRVARDAVEEDQLKWLRANTKPVFEIEGT